MSPPGKAVKVAKTEAEWRKHLTPEQYYVTRDHGTEHPFTGPHLHEKRPGVFACVCCGAPLFDAQTKYESGTGWPSFYAPIGPDVVSEYKDRVLFFIRRTEVRCASCDAHLGHVFPDGPRPTGRRYCMNGTALTFMPSSDA